MTLNPSTRASLLLRLRDSKDHEAWVEFISLYEPAVYRMLRRHGLQDADALEVMQELFLAVSRSIDRWDPARERGSFRGWLRRVARNLVINWLKHRQRRLSASGGSGMLDLLENLPAEDGPESAEFDQELRRTIFQKAADRVRVDVHYATWEAFWETAVLGTAVPDAAAKLGMSAGAVRIAKCRVLARIQLAVTEMEQEA